MNGALPSGSYLGPRGGHEDRVPKQARLWMCSLSSHGGHFELRPVLQSSEATVMTQWEVPVDGLDLGLERSIG